MVVEHVGAAVERRALVLAHHVAPHALAARPREIRQRAQALLARWCHVTRDRILIELCPKKNKKLKKIPMEPPMGLLVANHVGWTLLQRVRRLLSLVDHHRALLAQLPRLQRAEDVAVVVRRVGEAGAIQFRDCIELQLADFVRRC